MPLINVIWALVIIILLASLLMNQSYRELLLVSAITLLIPATFLTQSIHINVTGSTQSSSSSVVGTASTPIAAPTPAAVETRIPQPVSMPVIATQTPSTAPASSKPREEKFTPASGANYGYNPKPKYPAVARSRSWEGKVILNVRVSASGESEGVSVIQSSGHDILDEAAVSAVEGWRFVPAKRGDQVVASTVYVPINFKLDN